MLDCLHQLLAFALYATLLVGNGLSIAVHCEVNYYEIFELIHLF
jgi:hypothetical protein